MSYIRTKDSIYKVKTENEFTYDTTTGENIFKSDVIKEKDDIEDLCDEFVCAYKENNIKITYPDLDWAIDKLKRYAGPTTIYGAVWCEWGLKYVAKVNDKGELELI